MNHTNTLIRYAHRVNPKRLPCILPAACLTRARLPVYSAPATEPRIWGFPPITLPQAIRSDDQVRGSDPRRRWARLKIEGPNMYAVIKTGGKQYRVQPDDVLEIERLPGEAGDMLEFSQVLMVVNEAGIEVGTPVIADAIVAAELVEQTRGDKIKVFKKKRRKHYRRTMGHRQDLSQIRITEILTGGAKPTKKAAAKKKVPAKSGVKAGAKAEQTGKAEQPAPAVSEAAAEAPAKKAPAKKAPAKKAAAKKAPARKTAAKSDKQD
jgi:large subunit ribosomal protein L21